MAAEKSTQPRPLSAAGQPLECTPAQPLRLPTNAAKDAGLPTKRASNLVGATRGSFVTSFALTRICEFVAVPASKNLRSTDVQ